jgi:hypothetical protein
MENLADDVEVVDDDEYAAWRGTAQTIIDHPFSRDKNVKSVRVRKDTLVINVVDDRI